MPPGLVQACSSQNAFTKLSPVPSLQEFLLIVQGSANVSLPQGCLPGVPQLSQAPHPML